MKYIHYSAIVVFFIVVSCSTFTSTSKFKISQLKFLDDENFDSKTMYNNTLLGGLSGITYNEKNHRLIAISDDRGERGEPRFYEFSLEFDANNKMNIRPVKVQTLTNINGKSFKKGTIDFEGISLLKNGNILTSSEGDERPKTRIMPALTEYDLTGRAIKEWEIADQFLFEKVGTPSKGVRFNQAFESLSTTPDGEYTFTANENSLYQDGVMSSQFTSGLIRIVKYKNEKIEAMYPYVLSEIPNPNKHKELIGDNGVSDMLAIDENHLIVIERSWVQNDYKNRIKLFLVAIDNADDIKSLKSLKSIRVKTVKKTLLLDLDTITDKMDSRFSKLDNIEGITFGPTLPNGHKTLILASDNNFSKHQRTLFLAFEIIP